MIKDLAINRPPTSKRLTTRDFANKQRVGQPLLAGYFSPHSITRSIACILRRLQLTRAPLCPPHVQRESYRYTRYASTVQQTAVRNSPQSGPWNHSNQWLSSPTPPLLRSMSWSTFSALVKSDFVGLRMSVTYIYIHHPGGEG